MLAVAIVVELIWTKHPGWSEEAGGWRRGRLRLPGSLPRAKHGAGPHCSSPGPCHPACLCSRGLSGTHAAGTQGCLGGEALHPQPVAPVPTRPRGRWWYIGGVSGPSYPHPGEEPEAILAGHVLSCCRLPFPPGDRVTFNGKECMCQKCSLPKTAGSSVHLSQGLWSKWAPSGAGVG